MRRQTHTSILLVAALVEFTTAAGVQMTWRTQPEAGAGSQASSRGMGQEGDAVAEDELREGTALTRRGQFSQAIPHLLAAQGRLENDYRANFNLALCYVGINQFEPAVRILENLRAQGHDITDVNNLLAQAYIGHSDDAKALAALERAASLTPTNEKLYLFVADAAMGKQDYELGFEVVDLGLKHLPESAWLHYQRGMFLTLVDQFDAGKSEFALARKLAPDTDVAFIAATQEAMLEGNLKDAVRIAREGVRRGHEHFLLLSLLGKALLRSGITPGQPEFQQAQDLLEKSTREHPNDQGSQLALGELYLLAGRLEEAIIRLEMARRLIPTDPSVYSHLAVAYRRQGKTEKAQAALVSLAELNQRQAEKIRRAPGDTKLGYGAARPAGRGP